MTHNIPILNDVMLYYIFHVAPDDPALAQASVVTDAGPVEARLSPGASTGIT